MKAIAPASTPILVELVDGQPTTTNLDVSAHFGKRHADVIRAISKLDCSAEFTERNFALGEYTDSTGRKLTQYRLTRDGFTFLCMGFTGREAAKWKEVYSNGVNEMKRAERRRGESGRGRRPERARQADPPHLQRPPVPHRPRGNGDRFIFPLHLRFWSTLANVHDGS
ncbi:Rha family transcriptional regulator [Pseudomonas sp. GCM10022188]|uniref:Rha family transcriptional regulator n=1 Tax=Pseudomonas TaxID=286 RepID=UPI001E3D4AA5|nr:Rha family transcriptional regulator [Pseudomonas oryzagri]MCC6074040.1 Rha family transcriptional regulator [Pseudomonas oryzagri]